VLKQSRLPKVVRSTSAGSATTNQASRSDRPKMPHVGVHRLAAGDGETRGAETGEDDMEILVDQKIEG